MGKKLSEDGMLMSSVLGAADAPYIWVTSFEEEYLESFTKKFFELEEDSDVPVITIYISSYGGSVDTLLAMRDLIKSANKQVATIALGKAMSAGCALLASGTKGLRFAAPNTSIMVHEVASGHFGKITDTATAIEDIKRINTLLQTLLAEDCGKPADYFTKAIAKRRNADWFMTAAEAQKLGIVDRVELPRMMSGEQPPVVLALGSYTKTEAPKAPPKKK